MKIDANDPKWTAYALGEITDETERAEMESILKGSAEIRRLVDEIRMTAGLLKEELQAEPAVQLTQAQREQIEKKATGHRNWFGLRPTWAIACAAAAILLMSVVVVKQLGETTSHPSPERVARNAVPNTPVRQPANKDIVSEEQSRDKARVQKSTAIPADPSVSGNEKASATSDRSKTNAPADTPADLSGTKQDEYKRLAEKYTPNHPDLRKEASPAGPSTTVEVTGQSKSGDFSTGPSTVQVIDQKFIQDLPIVSNNAIDVVRAMGGVQGPAGDKSEQDLSGLMVMGTPASGVQVIRDGINTHDARYDSGLSTPSHIGTDAVDEFKVVLSPADAEYGRGGPQVLIPKSGAESSRRLAYEKSAQKGASAEQEQPIGDISKPPQSAMSSGSGEGSGIGMATGTGMPGVGARSRGGGFGGGGRGGRGGGMMAGGGMMGGGSGAPMGEEAQLRMPRLKALTSPQPPPPPPPPPPARQRITANFGGPQLNVQPIPPRPPNYQGVWPPQRYHLGWFNTEAYDHIRDNEFLDVGQEPLSTFSIDVDTASYSNMRRFLDRGQFPPVDAIRIEELVNYFDYEYKAPKDGQPFAANFEITEAPWNPSHRLLRIALKGREVNQKRRPNGNLVFLLDVSGSMGDANKLPLVKESMKMLVDKLTEADRIAIVTYSTEASIYLPSARGDQKEKLWNAIDQLHAAGSTNGAGGIQLAYQVAQENFIKGGTNRVILATDGDFNVGITDRGSLTRLIENKAESGIFLSALGYGMGNLKDSTLELLADKGRGNYAYIDNLQEAQKVLVDQMDATLVAIAKDVKIQVEFNPVHVSAYRLIGYEDRVMAKEDFNNDAKKAGVIGAGHAITALYELIPSGMSPTPGVDPLKYQRQPQPSQAANSDEVVTVKVRSKDPEKDTSVLSEFTVKESEHKFRQASIDFKFAAAVAAFGMILRNSPYQGDVTFLDVLNWATAGKGDDVHGYRADFIRLVHQAMALHI